MADERTGRDRPESAPERAHGTHGKGDSREEYRNDERVHPGNESRADTPSEEAALRDSAGELGDAGWGSAASGGSVMDRRSPDEKGRNG